MIKDTLEYVANVAIPAGLAFLPPVMDSTSARVLLAAIALQESNCAHRVQVGGPAHGFWQFERGWTQGAGVRGVFEHAASRPYLLNACGILVGERDIDKIYAAIVQNDVLAVVVARLLLWTDAHPLPPMGDQSGGWEYYLRNWRPGAPHPAAWPANYATAKLNFEGKK